MVAIEVDYARTPPEARKGLVVFVVRLVEVDMAGDHRGVRHRRQRPRGAELVPIAVESGAVLTQ
ncbi:MAG: hypothetical protein EKK32_28115 [Bradyrhizobiaceae bacterium]|jgi:hypothetical protein|nr:hypothetical protein BBta_4364 [Bradyrhizobium sp. BTAi1]MDU6377323.1 hypothetical protein [Bradyrhizobium sp.]MDU6725397.1 hypothetical protein [Bradyrhizobium sp.]RTL93948.1 MAG: hypothetical protein EKK32_28115 [Bradyrhizobiaceae bacterium]